MLEKDGSLVLCWTLFWWVTFTAAVVVVTTTESDMFSLFFGDFFNSELLSSTITKESILLLLDSCRSRLDLELESSSSSSSSSCWPQTPIKNKKKVSKIQMNPWLRAEWSTFYTLRCRYKYFSKLVPKFCSRTIWAPKPSFSELADIIELEFSSSSGLVTKVLDSLLGELIMGWMPKYLWYSSGIWLGCSRNIDPSCEFKANCKCSPEKN